MSELAEPGIMALLVAMMTRTKVRNKFKAVSLKKAKRALCNHTVFSC